MARISEMHYSNTHASNINTSEYLEIAVTPDEHAAIQDGSVQFVASFYEADGSLIDEFDLATLPIGGVVFDADANEYIYTLDQQDAIDGTFDGNGDGFETGIALTDPDGGGANNAEAFALTNVTTGEVINFYDLSSGSGNSNTTAITATEGAVFNATSGPQTSITINLANNPSNTIGSVQFNQPNVDTPIIDSISLGESGVVCFVQGTFIETEFGTSKIEELAVGDRIPTFEHGLKRIKWVGRTRVSGLGNLAPIRIRKSTFGLLKDLYLSPNHRIALADVSASLVSDVTEFLVPAKHLVGRNGVERVAMPTVTYFHIMFDQHELIKSNGIWTESFYPGKQALSDLEEEARLEILDLFPYLLQETDVPLCLPEFRSWEVPMVLHSATAL